MYRLVLHGSKDGSSAGVQAFKIRLAQKLGMPGQAIEAIFTELPYILKEDLTQEQANKLKQIIDTLGAVTEIEEVPDIDLTLMPAEEPEQPEAWHESALNKEEDLDLTLQPDTELQLKPLVTLEEDAKDSSLDEEVDQLSNELDGLLGGKTSEADGLEFEESGLEFENDETDLSLKDEEPEENVIKFEEEPNDKGLELKPEDNGLSFEEDSGLSFDDDDGLDLKAEEPEEQAVETPPAPDKKEPESELTFDSEEEPEEQEEEEEEEEAEPTAEKPKELTPEEEEELMSKAFAKGSSAAPGSAPKKKPAPAPRDKSRSGKSKFYAGAGLIAAIMAGLYLYLAQPPEPKVTYQFDEDEILRRQDRILGEIELPVRKKKPAPKTTAYRKEISREGILVNLRYDLLEDGKPYSIKVEARGEPTPELTKEQIVRNEQRTPWLKALKTTKTGDEEFTALEDGRYKLIAYAWLTNGDKEGRVIADVFVDLSEDGHVEAFYLFNENDLPESSLFRRVETRNTYEFYFKLPTNADPEEEN